MAKADRDDSLDTLASRLFAAMLDDIAVDVALQSHQEVARSRRKCDVCHTHRAATTSQSTLPSSRPGTPPRDAGTPATGTPNGSSVNKDGTVLLDCVGCGRAMASNRYASHLSGCIGIGTGTRRAAARNATSKSKLENGNASDNAPPPPGPKKKGRPPKNKPKVPVQVASNDDGEALSNRKRHGSPLSSPTKNAKKQKVSEYPPCPPGPKSQSKIPSRLRESSTASFLEPDAIGASPGSRSSSPGTAERHNGGVSVEEKKVAPRIPSPPRPLPPVTRRPETDYLVDVEGDETGSSTDTDTE
ncbi:hypothetical protein BJV74DRAFT_804578 [Russula compacta]|nr:hypothetical protein BJV74DRAFT_804578 [Russula compacta]